MPCMLLCTPSSLTICWPLTLWVSSKTSSQAYTKVERLPHERNGQLFWCSMCLRARTMILFVHNWLHNFRMQGPPLVKKKYTIPLLLWNIEHKQKTNEQARIAKFQKDPGSKNKDRCTNPKSGWPRGHSTKDCWFKGGASAHKAPEWWREKHVKRTSKMGKSAKVNIAEEAKGSSEAANVSVELDTPLGSHFQDGYESYMWMRTMQASLKSGQETGMNSVQPWDWPTGSNPWAEWEKYALLCMLSPHTALTLVAWVIVPLFDLTSLTSHLYPIV